MRDDGVDAVLKARPRLRVRLHPSVSGRQRAHAPLLIHHVLAERRFTPPG